MYKLKILWKYLILAPNPVPEPDVSQVQIDDQDAVDGLIDESDDSSLPGNCFYIFKFASIWVTVSETFFQKIP